MPVKWLPWWPFAPVELWRMNRLDEWGTFPHLNLDTTHLATKGWDPFAIYERVRSRVAHIHLSNALQVGRRVREHRRLEDGDLPLDAFLGRLARDGYGGVVTVELQPSALEADVEERVREHLGRQIAFCRQYSRQATAI